MWVNHGIFSSFYPEDCSEINLMYFNGSSEWKLKDRIKCFKVAVALWKLTYVDLGFKDGNLTNCRKVTGKNLLVWLWNYMAAFFRFASYVAICSL